MYKLYSTGQEFLDENLNIIRNDPLGTTFFEYDARLIQQCDTNSWAARVDVDGETLIAIRVDNLPLVMYGSERCASELASVVAERQLQFGKLLGYSDLLNAFLTAYEQIAGGAHDTVLYMDVMRCDKVNLCDTSAVERATDKDASEIAQLTIDFTLEALGEKPTWGEVFEQTLRRIGAYSLLRVDGKIVSIASGYDEDNGVCRIANVYTLPKYRNKGYSRKVVTHVTEQAIRRGKLPFLHVDQHNPVSNHLYLSIGYTYGKSRYEMEYRKTK